VIGEGGNELGGRLGSGPGMSPARRQLEARPGLGAALLAVWARLGAPGASWTGQERLAIVAEARAARSGQPPTRALRPAVADAVGTVAARPSSIRRRWVEQAVAAGLGYAGYVELVGVVSRTVAIDTLFEALGMDPEPLPVPIDGDPTEDIDRRARVGKAWVPMVGGASITQALSLVPAENSALEEMHGHLYLRFEEMADPAVSKGLTRPQMELVAARTSAVNECFY
jgi:hypothetical protein